MDNTIDVKSKKDRTNLASLKKKRRKKTTFEVFLHVIIIIGAIVMVFPFVWMFLSAVKPLEQVFAVPPVWIPNPFVWENFSRSFEAMPFGRGYFNSFYISVIVVASQLLTGSMAAYAFAKIEFPGSKQIFMLFLATMMVPYQVTLIPLYLIIDQLGLLNTHLSIILPNSLFNAFGVFLLRQFIKGIPREMEEAAIVDGANPLQIYVRVILPLITSALSAFGIFSFMGIWNNFMQPLIFLNSTELFTVPLMLEYFKGQYTTQWPLMMAGATISVLPILIVYIFAQRRIIEGIALTGVKG